MDKMTFFVKRLRGARDWPQTEATIQACAWNNDTSALRRLPPFDFDRYLMTSGWYEIVYSYCIDGEYYSGDFILEGASDSSKPFHSDDKLTVHYNPRHPQQTFPSRIGDQKADSFKMRTSILIGLFLVACLVGFFMAK
jgi:hypothetical protein